MSYKNQFKIIKDLGHKDHKAKMYDYDCDVCFKIVKGTQSMFRIEYNQNTENYCCSKECANMYILQHL